MSNSNPAVSTRLHRPNVLVVGLCDPHPRVEIYAKPRSIHLKTILAPRAESCDQELAAEKFVDSQLEFAWQKLYLPGYLAESMMIDCRGLEQLTWSRQQLEYLRKTGGNHGCC